MKKFGPKSKIIAALIAAIAFSSNINAGGYYPPGGSSTITSGTTVTSGCTASGILFSASNLAVCSDASFLYSATGAVGGGPLLTIGTGTTTSTGWKIGGLGSGFSGLWHQAVTASASNYTLLTSNNAGDLRLNTVGTGYSAVNGTRIFGWSSDGIFLTANNKLLFGVAAPTYASGGCLTGAGTVVTNSNSTAYITITNGTGCSGSQPIVLTLATATTGWNCYARNVSNPASSSPAQSSAVSTTSVTITNYSRTLGTAAAWTDSDIIVVSCLGG